MRGRRGTTAVGASFTTCIGIPEGQPYANPNELALRVYRRRRTSRNPHRALELRLREGWMPARGSDNPLAGPQRRLRECRPMDRFLGETEDLERAMARPSAGHGGPGPAQRAGARSEPAFRGALRAVWPSEAGRFYMHLSEQPAEVEACVSETGLRPVELVAETGLLSARFCAVHAIHVQQSEIDLLGQAGAAVCVCPTTERDLGDGIVPADARCGAPESRLALGTDSNTQIDLLEEARSMELNLRLLRQERILVDPATRRTRAAGLARTALRGGHGRRLASRWGCRREGWSRTELADLVSLGSRRPLSDRTWARIRLPGQAGLRRSDQGGHRRDGERPVRGPRTGTIRTELEDHRERL